LKTIENTLDILEVLLHHGGEVSMLELSNQSGLNNNSVYRIISTLRKRGYLKQKKKGSKCGLGPKFLEYCQLVKNQVKIEDVAYLYQKELCEVTGESINFSVLDEKRISAIDNQIFHTPHALKVAMEEGAELPLYCTATGKILLANMDSKEQDKYLKKMQLTSYTDNTTTSVQKLKKQLEEIRENNIAFDYEEFLLGVRAVASKVFDEKGNTIAAFGIFGPSARISLEKLKEFVPLVTQYAHNLSQGIGFKNK
jgi:IclR family transcriptional regulator, KDG regulon repressor